MHLVGRQSDGSAPTTFTWRRATWTFLGTLLIVNFALVIGLRTGRWDAIDYFCPYFTLVADAARQGQLVVWSPLVNGGCPVGFEPQVGAASPLEIALAFLTGGGLFGFHLYWLLLWCLGGLGILVLARHLAAPAWIACIGAIGYAFSAIYMAHAEHTSYVLVMSLFPWALWRLDVAIVRRSLFAAVQAGAIWGLSALGGYPGLVLAGAGYVVAWAFGRTLLADEPESPSSAPGRIRRWGFVAVVLAVYFAVGLVVLSPTYVGFFIESRGYTSRADDVSREIALHQGAFPVAGLATFASPFLSVWNAQSRSPLWGNDVSMSSIYMSPLLLIVALSVAWQGGQRRFRGFLLVVAIFYLLLALGGATPLYGWLYDLLPPIRYLRFAALFRCHYLFSLVVLAMLAVVGAREAVDEAEADSWWRNAAVASAAAAALALAAFVAVAWLSTDGQDKPFQLAFAVVALIGVWGAVALLSLWGYREKTVRRQVVYRYFVVLAIVDAAMTMGLSEWAVYTNPQPWREAASHRVASLDLTARGLDRQLSTDAVDLPRNGNLLTKTPVLSSYAGMVNAFHDAYVAHPLLRASALGPDRLWFSPRSAKTQLNAPCFQRFVAATERLGRPCLVVSDRNAGSDASQEAEMADLPAMEPLAATLVEYSPDGLVFDATVPDDGWILATDRWANGWRAEVNGQAVDVMIGNFIFRAVRVKRGANRVAFRYRPFGHPWLLLSSWTTLGVVLMASAAGPAVKPWRARRRNPA